VNISRARIATQLVSLLVLNLGLSSVLKTGLICPALYCYGCPLAAFACPIGVLQNYIILGRIPFYVIGTLGIYGVSLGRFFCGWCCPFGSFQELLSRLRKGKSFNPKPLWFLKYGILVGVILTAWITLDTFFCKLCPSASLFAAIPSAILYPELPFGFFFYVHLFTLVISIVLFILVSRFWCRYLCPMASILGTFNKVSLLKIERNLEKCDKCGVCLRACPMNIQEVDKISASSDCIKCGQCVDACPRDILKIKIG